LLFVVLVYGPYQVAFWPASWGVGLQFAVFGGAVMFRFLSPRPSSPQPSLRDKTVVVTGATAGVGRAVATRFGREGARVGLLARDNEALQETKAALELQGATIVTAAVDSSDAASVFAAAEKFENELGPIAVWVNAAMVTVFSPVQKMTPEEFQRVTAVTYLGFVNGTLAALRHMQPRDQGTIIQIGSALAYRGIPLQAAYCGAKFAIRGFTEALRSELLHAKSNIRLSMIQLPGINTPQFDWARAHIGHHPRPVAPVLEPEVVAEAVLRATYEGRSEYWLGKTAALLILGNMLLPGLVDRYLARTAFKGQQTSEPIPDNRPNNLFEPMHEYHRTRGSFSREAYNSAALIPARMARVATLLTGTAATIGLGYLLGRYTGNRFVDTDT
jgi:NAD(P)-dependent dehydrogenase (short-subunit alcohol dehydrogenase family)